MSKFFLSFCFCHRLWSWNLHFKNQKCIWVRLNVSHNMIYVVDHLCECWMSGVIHISYIYYPWFKHHHSSFIDTIDDLYFSIKFCKVKNVIPLKQKSCLRVVFRFFFWLFIELDFSSKPLSNTVLFLIFNNFFFIVFVIISSVIKNFLKLYSFSNNLLKLFLFCSIHWAVSR